MSKLASLWILYSKFLISIWLWYTPVPSYFWELLQPYTQKKPANGKLTVRQFCCNQNGHSSCTSYSHIEIIFRQVLLSLPWLCIIKNWLHLKRKIVEIPNISCLAIWTGKTSLLFLKNTCPCGLDSRGGIWKWRQQLMGMLLYAQFYCDPKTALKIKFI